MIEFKLYRGYEDEPLAVVEAEDYDIARMSDRQLVEAVEDTFTEALDDNIPYYLVIDDGRSSEFKHSVEPYPGNEDVLEHELRLSVERLISAWRNYG